jgi:hypothetical protein
MRPLVIVAALALASPALLSAARGGLDVDTALIRLVLALLACAAVDIAVRAWWSAQPAPAGDDTRDPVGEDLGDARGARPGTPTDRRRTDRAGAAPRR